jgi:hypothetical protein
MGKAPSRGPTEQVIVMRMVLAAAALAAIVSGCQTTQESAVNADMTCREAGLRPGSAAFNRCTAAAYNSNRRQADQATNAVVAGAAVGVLGGALVGAAASRPSYGYRGYGYGRCNAYGCW